MDEENINELIDKYSSMTDVELQAVLDNHGDDRLEVLRAKAALLVLEQRRRDAEAERLALEQRNRNAKAALLVLEQRRGDDAPAPVVTSAAVRQEGDRRVVITDVRIPFWSMVELLVMVSVASIPACFIFWLMWMGLFTMYKGCTYSP